jgi:zinc transport system substrate-binding protein
MEPWAQKTLESIDQKEVEVIEALNLVPIQLQSDHEEEHGHEEEEGKHENEDEHEEAGLDPHVWLDLENAQVIVETIASKLTEIDRENPTLYQSNANSYLIKLQALDNSFEQKLANCEQTAVISGGHNAFSYLANRYGFEIFSSHDLAPDSEPSPRRIEELFNLAREQEVNYVVFEELVNPRLAEVIAEEVGAKTLVINPGGNLPKERFEAGVSFIDLMEENRDNLAIALECK